MFEDVDYAGTETDYDGGSVDAALPNVDVELYDEGDTFLASTTTGPGGSYAFESIAAGIYKVRVRSATIGDDNTPPASGFNSPCGISDPESGPPCSLPELTWAHGGPLPGGQDPLIDDTATVDDSGPGDTYVIVGIEGADLLGVNFGITYRLIVNTNDGGQGSLRQFIQNGNANRGSDSSYFRIPMTDPGYTAVPLRWTVLPLIALPAIADPLVIDGTTQSGYAGTPIMEIDGSLAGPISGLRITGNGSTIRGLVINRFSLNGLFIAGSSNTVERCYIGTDVTGVVDLGNSEDGIQISGNANVIGSTVPLLRNVISGNADEGVDLNPGATGNIIIGNFIGTDATATTSIGNGSAGFSGGVLIDATGNRVGGSAAGEGNVISGNAPYGILLSSSSSANLIHGNFIGTDLSGTEILGNSIAGVRLRFGAFDNSIGGTKAGEGNLIVNNGDDGVSFEIDAASGNMILGNSIFSNGGLGIDLNDDGITANDANDVDFGPNDLLNHPVISFANSAGGNIDVDFDLDLPAGNYRIEFFKNPAGADPSGNGEGAVFSGSLDVAHAGAGPQSYSHVFPGIGAEIITATTTVCTDGPACSTFGSTSEFSGAVTAISGGTISGTVFEDVNYGGGAGRDLASAAADAPTFVIERQNVIVELYDAGGSFVTSTTTAANGTYSFVGLVPGLFSVRVVNDSVTSSRSGSNGAEQLIQTFRIDGDGEAAGTGARKVGGEEPASIDAPANAGSDTLADLRIPASQYTQSVVTVEATGGDVTGVDFGFNADTIVNTNDYGPGSLRQFILNANLLMDETSMDQDDSLMGLPAGFEHSIFMIPSPGDPLGRPTDGGYTVSPPEGGAGGAFVFSPASVMPAVTGESTALEGRTQTGYSGNTNLPIPEVTTGPEVILDFAGLDPGSAGLEFRQANCRVHSLGVGNTTGGSSEVNVGLLIDGSSAAGCEIRNSTLWSLSSYGIFVRQSKDIVIQGNVSRDNGKAHVSADGIHLTSVSNVRIVDNSLIGNGGYGLEIHGNDRILVEGNLLKDNGTQSLEQAGIGLRTIQNSLIRDNDITGNLDDGIVLRGGTGNRISENRISGNADLGIDIDLLGGTNGNGVTINDLGDLDGGPNDLFNFPVVQASIVSGGNLTVLGFARPGSVIELFLSATDPTGFGEGGTYLVTMTEGGTGAGGDDAYIDEDGTTGSYSPPVNGLGQGSDNTNRFRFTIPLGDLPVPVTPGVDLTATATGITGSFTIGGSNYILGNTSEFGGVVTVAGLVSVSGTVYEDVNYGGGPGRDHSSAAADAPAFTVERPNVRVELYDAIGSFVTSTTTAVDGTYGFSGLAPGMFTVRVVNDTVSSGRAGSDGTEVLVQTYRIDGAGEAAGTGASKVGGEEPASVDAPANGGADALAALQAPAGQVTQSIVTIDATGGDVDGVDFGYNADTIVNTADAGQGSLRRFILNSNLLTDQASLDQADSLVTLPAGVENSVFMIPAPADPLGRPADPGYTGTPPDGSPGSAFVIEPMSAMPSLTDGNTSVNGLTQTAFSGDTSLPLPEVTTGPEIILDYGGTVTGPGIEVTGPDVLIEGVGVGSVLDGGGSSGRGISVAAEGTIIRSITTWDNGHDGVRLDSSSGFQMLDSVSRGNGQSNNTNDGIQVSNASTNGTIRDNQFIDNNGYGIDINSGSSNFLIENNLVKGNGFGGTAQNAGIGFERAPAGTGSTIRQNTIIGSFGAGVVVDGNFTDITISKNSIVANGGLGIDLAIETSLSGNGITPNDPGDGDSGGNDLLNHPVLTSASVTAGTVTVDFDLDLPAGDYRIEFFTNPSGADPSGNGEGETFAGVINVAHAGAGAQSYVHAFAGAVGDVITATTTVCLDGPSCASLGGTSEFSASRTADSLRSMGGNIYHDINANSVLDLGELGIGSGWVKLIDAGVVVQVVPADPDTGAYSFNVTDGSYTVIVDDNDLFADITPTPPLNWLFQNPITGSLPVVVSGSDVTGQNLGLVFDFDLSADCVCGYQDGLYTQRTIVVDGDMTDWGPILSDPDNNACDASDSSDLDDPVQSTGRNMVRVAATWDSSFFSMWTERIGSSNNTQNFIYYADTDNDGILQGGEPVVVARWQGSTGNVVVEVYSYDDLGSGGDPLLDPNGYADGYSMPGDLNFVSTLPAGSGAGLTTGPAAGSQMEWSASWADLGVAPGAAIAWHISSTNANPGSAGLSAQIDDNLGGCGGQCTGSNQFGGVTPVPIAVGPGQIIHLAHRITNTGNGNDVFDLTWTSSGSFTPISVIFYLDLGTVGQYDPGVDTALTDTDGDSIVDTGTLAAGASINVLVAVAIPVPPTTGSIDFVTIATSSFIPGCGGTTQPVSGSVTNTLMIPEVDLVVTKDDGMTSAVPGTNLTYTITVTNKGPDDSVGASVSDTFDPTYFDVAAVSWTCAITTAGSGADACSDPGPTTGDIATTVDLSSGAVATFMVTAPILPSAAGTISNTATVAPLGEAETAPGDNSATDSDTVLGMEADLSVTKDDARATYTPGGTVTYTIVVSNAGPSDVTGATVVDMFDITRLTNVSWACVGTGGAACTAGGTGNISDMADVPAGETVTYTATADVLASAGGSLVNTATVTEPAGLTDPVPENNTDTDTDTLDAQADLSITKDDGQAIYTPGGTVTYTIVVSNAGPSDATGATVADTFDTTRLTNIDWTCVGTGSAACTASGTGNIGDTVDVPVGETITYTATADVLPSAGGNLVNTATVTEPAGLTDPVPGNNIDADTDTLDAQADLSITKDDGQATYTPGGTVTYTIVVSNAGPSDVTGATVADSFDATRLTGISWTCVGSGGATCTASGTGDINDPADVPVGETVTYTVTASILAGAAGNLVNTATVTEPAGITDPDGSDNSATDTDTRQLMADLSITKDDGQLTYVPGGTVTYTIVLSNAGPSDVTGVNVGDSFPPQLTNVSWTCVAAGGSSCGSASGIGAINETVDVPVGGTVTYTATADVLSSASGNLVNTAVCVSPPGAIDPDSSNDTDSDTDTLQSEADLSITKDDGQVTYVPGGTVSYTIVVSNAGPSDVVGATVTDALPAQLTNASWTCAAAGGAACGAATGSGSISESIDLPVAGMVTYTLSADILASAAGDLVNTASVQEPVGVTDPAPENNSAIDTDTIDPRANLSITKTDGLTSAISGTALIYTIGITNNGPSDVTGASIMDTFPPGVIDVSNVIWTCAITAGGGSCSDPGPTPGDIATTVDLESGATATFTASAPTLAGISATVINTATVSPPAGTTDPDASDDEATDATDLQPPAPSGSVIIVKSVVEDQVVVGDLVGYTIEAENVSAVPLTGVTLLDSPAGGFKLVEDSARMRRPGTDGLLDTTDDITTAISANGGRPVQFGPVDLAPGETVRISYLLRVGPGALPGDHENRATPVQAGAAIGNTATANVTVVTDPTFDLSTVIGKVFEDRNRDGWQDLGEPGVSGVMVALDDGTYAITDAHGRYHFPAVIPGQRMIKMNIGSLPRRAEATDGVSRILWVTPGLLARASFGLVFEEEDTRIGSPGVPGVSVESDPEKQPFEIVGSAETLVVLINDRMAPLPDRGIRVATKALDETIEIKGNALVRPVEFNLETDSTNIRSWSLWILDSDDNEFKVIEGRGTPPPTLSWDGRDDDGDLVVAGAVYQYQLELAFGKGSHLKSERRLLGVNKSSVIALDLTGEAFETNRADLSVQAKKVLSEIAPVLRRFPQEKVTIEGHTDSVGSASYNMDLSRRRAEAAAKYLVQDLGLSDDNFVLRWHGEDRPVATNTLAEGRALNRRVEIKGEVIDLTEAEILNQYRTEPRVTINGQATPVASDGRFAARVDEPSIESIEVEIANTQGRSISTEIPVPDIEIRNPTGRIQLGYGASGDGCRIVATDAESMERDGEGAVVCMLEVRTAPENTLMMDGTSVPLSRDGGFTREIALSKGRNSLGFLVRNPQGFSRIANLDVTVSDRDLDGDVLIMTEAIPDLTINLPPAGSVLAVPSVQINGVTAAGNSVVINGQPVSVSDQGRFDGLIELPRGTSTIEVTVADPEGRTGSITREIEVKKHDLFLLAFADGKVGRLRGDGQLDDTGIDEGSSFFSEGRIAYYLKGVIAGKYLITSALDTGKSGSDAVFKDLDAERSNLLLANLDPDKFYPVYGDDSTVVYDAESDGNFYLALDSEALHVLVGNYPLALTETELSAYQRTLYGGRVSYQSLSRTQYGAPDTEVVVFGAELNQVHVRDEVRATGGSLYYLSHRDVVEGSEQVTLVVRDQQTGLVLNRQVQRQNFDYEIKYPEGRLMFRRPISTIAQSDTLVTQAILSGNPVFIQIDYETQDRSLDKTATGGRVRQQVGDHVAVGATYVDDTLRSGPYELKGVDTEVRFGKNSRLVAEFADSSGTDALAFTSDDGGLTFTQSNSLSSTIEGEAWKAAAELDVGEWFGKADRYTLRAYAKELDAGFLSSGNFLEQGTRRFGFNAGLKVTETDSIRLRLDEEDRTDTGSTLPGAVDQTSISSVQWNHTRKSWGFSVEHFGTNTEDTNGRTLTESRIAGGRLWLKPTDKITARAEQQETLDGPENDQTTVGLSYQVLPSLALEMSGTDGSIGHSLQAGAVLTVGESRVYVREGLAEDRAGDRKSRILGAESTLGPTTKVYSEHQWEDSDREDRAISLVGIQKQWQVEKGLKFTLSGENARIDAGVGDSKRTAVAGGVTFAGQVLKASSRNEVRFEDGTTDRVQYFTVSQADVRISPDFTFLGRFRYSKTRDRGQNLVEARLEERSGGFAYRPVAHDRFNALVRYTRLLDQRPASLSGQSGRKTVMDVMSMEAVYDINRRLEWLGKGAFRVQTEDTEVLSAIKTHTWLGIQRFNYNFWRKMGLGIEYRQLSQKETDDRRSGWLSELSWDLTEHFRIGAGYNFTDFSDNEFSVNEYSVHGSFIRVQGRY